MRLQPSVATHAACVNMAVLLQVTWLHLHFLAVALSVSASSYATGARDSGGLEIRCGEAEVRVTVQRRLLEERRVPFRREHLRLGAKPTRGPEAACGPRGLMTGEAEVISAGLRDCGAESRVRGRAAEAKSEHSGRNSRR
ncbi:unnamed protein product [Pleuronectes platessa]|uniref:Uncharacterized protein n=1 Tax=Pleuronectes platessa TaxID=8262 RepID=A0A9N7YQW1_PLEPL|nr:unnamed protein product [Pleuronectes platessa]